jgi:hypothetical protein
LGIVSAPNFSILPTQLPSYTDSNYLLRSNCQVDVVPQELSVVFALELACNFRQQVGNFIQHSAAEVKVNLDESGGLVIVDIPDLSQADREMLVNRFLFL